MRLYIFWICHYWYLLCFSRLLHFSSRLHDRLSFTVSPKYSYMRYQNDTPQKQTAQIFVLLFEKDLWSWDSLQDIETFCLSFLPTILSRRNDWMHFPTLWLCLFAVPEVNDLYTSHNNFKQLEYLFCTYGSTILWSHDLFQIFPLIIIVFEVSRSKTAGTKNRIIIKFKKLCFASFWCAFLHVKKENAALSFKVMNIT